MKDWKVQIKKRYRNTLSNRFDIKGAKLDEVSDIYKIVVPCNLCGVYYLYNCGNCPFVKFGTPKHVGCIIWLKRIGAITRHRRFSIVANELNFDAYKYNLVKKQLERLKKKASEYIEWV